MFEFWRKWLSESRLAVQILKLAVDKSQPIFWFHCTFFILYICILVVISNGNPTPEDKSSEFSRLGVSFTVLQSGAGQLRA